MANQTRNQHHHTFLARAVILSSICISGVALGTGPVAAPSGGGGGGHEAAAPSGGGHASPPPAAHTEAPSTPVTGSAASGGNPTTPAGTHQIEPTQTNKTASDRSGTASPVTQNHHQHAHDQRYETIYANPWYTGWNSGWYGYGNNNGYNDPSYGLTSTNNNNNNNAPTTPTPDQAPIPPVDNANSIAAQNQNALNNAPQMVSVNDSIQQAQAAFDADRERVLGQLKDNPDYQKAVAQKQDAAKQVNNSKPGATVTPTPALMDAAASKMDASDEVTKLQEQAIAADPKAQADKEQLAKLVSARDALQAKLKSEH